MNATFNFDKETTKWRVKILAASEKELIELFNTKGPREDERILYPFQESSF
jgi:hypothetical protein